VFISPLLPIVDSDAILQYAVLHLAVIFARGKRENDLVCWLDRRNDGDER
jgi:hypothetical protein